MSPVPRMLRCRPGLQCNQRQAVEPVDLNSDNEYAWDPSAIKGRETGAYYSAHLALMLPAVAVAPGIYAMALPRHKTQTRTRSCRRDGAASLCFGAV